jgi:hemerythrin superfamily protein
MHAHALTRCYSQLLNEIMPLIYKRFTDKSAEEWRQIYKVWKDGYRVGRIYGTDGCFYL